MTKRRGRRSPFIVCGTVVVLGTGIAMWLLQPSAEPPPRSATATSSSHIQEVTPVAAPTNVMPKRKTYKDMTRDEKLKYFRDRYGNNLPENLKPVVYYLENPPQRTFHPKRQKYDIFKRSSEREIAAFILVEPGSWMMRPPEFGERFDDDLRAALSESIEISMDDDEETRALKQAVIDTKKELAERIAAGEKGSDIMNEAGKSLYDLGQYRRNLEEQVGEIRRNSKYTDQDMEDVVKAANEMLSKKGLKPLKMPNAMLRRACLKVAGKRAAAKAEQGKRQEKRENEK